MSIRSELQDEFQERERQKLICEIMSEGKSEYEASYDPRIVGRMEQINQQRSSGWY